jgi:Cu-processing system permease protein
MRRVLAITGLTHEAVRRKILVAMLAGGIAFLIVYAIGTHFVIRDFEKGGGGASAEGRLLMNFFALAGLFAVNYLLVMTSVLLPVDALSGEISSGVMQTVAARPVRRVEILLGKWLAYVVLAGAYLTFMAGGVLTIIRLRAGFTPPNVAAGLSLMLLEAVVFVSLAIAGGTRLSTVTNGIVVFALFGLAFVANWIEQIGTVVGNHAARNIGTVASLIMPSESLWVLASSQMQPRVMRDLMMTPFSPVAVPTNAMVVWAAAYVIVVLLVGIRSFSKRPL